MKGHSHKFLEVKGLQKHFGEKSVLRCVDFNADEGMIVGIIGPNGSGKTTLFRILTTLITPDSGEFWIDGISGIKDWLKVRRYIAYCPDKLPFDWNITGFDYLDLFRRLYNRKRSEVMDVLDMVGLLDDAKRPVRKFSSGMIKRVALARVLLGKGRFLLFDEPTAGLDPQGQRMIQDLLLKMDKTGKVILICSHNLYEIQRICDIILSLKDGKVDVVDSLNETFEVGGLIVIELVLRKGDDRLVQKMLIEFPFIKLISMVGARVRLSSEEKVDLIELATFLRDRGGEVIEVKFL